MYNRKKYIGVDWFKYVDDAICRVALILARDGYCDPVLYAKCWPRSAKSSSAVYFGDFRFYGADTFDDLLFLIHF